jgi:uncharacterized membrane protein SirB2
MPYSAYPLLKSAHMTLVGASVLLFVLRGVATLAAARWPMNPAVRWTSVVIDTGLLLAGVTLWWMLGMPLTGQAWLGVKLLLLPVYVVLGSFALKRARSRAARAVFFGLALATVAYMVAVAVAHHPLGPWAP